LVTVLNLIWIALALGSVGALLVSERWRVSTRSARVQRMMAVLLASVSLFPCVSASDDVISFGYVSADLETRSGFGHSVPDTTNSNTVVYLALQNLEHLQVTAFFTLVIAFCFFGLVSFQAPRSVFRKLPSFLSRAPPQIPALP